MGLEVDVTNDCFSTNGIDLGWTLLFWVGQKVMEKLIHTLFDLNNIKIQWGLILNILNIIKINNFINIRINDFYRNQTIYFQQILILKYSS